MLETFETSIAANLPVCWHPAPDCPSLSSMEVHGAWRDCSDTTLATVVARPKLLTLTALVAGVLKVPRPHCDSQWVTSSA